MKIKFNLTKKLQKDLFSIFYQTSKKTI